MFNRNPTMRAGAIDLLLFRGKLTTSGFLDRHLNGNSIQLKTEKTQVLK
jgi:hypothetical protein